MLKRTVLIGALLMISGEASARTCHIIECEQRRAGEVCKVRPCPEAKNLRCYSGRYTVGDGNWTYRGGSQAQCENRCASNPNCIVLEYYYGREGVKCNLYSHVPQIRWNSAQDAIICAWE